MSEDLQQILLDLHVPPARRSLILNAIDADRVRRNQTVEEARRRLGMAENRLVIGAVGRLAEEKGFDLLIRAVDQLLHDGLDVELLIVGEGPEHLHLQARIDDLRRADRIHLLGHRTDLKDLYEAMDVFVLSSLREGLPNVLLEAMAHEVAIVATRVAAVPRVVTDGVSGSLVPPGSLEALAKALARLLTNAALRRQLAVEARKTIETQFSFAARMQRVCSIYDNLLARNRDSDRLAPALGVRGER